VRRPASAATTAALLALLLGGAAALDARGAAGQEPGRAAEIEPATFDPETALRQLRTAPGYQVSLFASERDFPIGNPVALAFDGRGRLWVATMPSYPHFRPGDPPTDKLIVLEDTDGDGRADRYTVFADSLYLALGFELGDGGVYVSQQPNLLFLRDTDGDGVADERRVILHGFGTEDSHHAISAFTWGPDGALYFQEGTFLHTQVETPYGPVRVENGAVFRYEPHTARLGVFTSYPFANPWGHVFDRWGQNIIADASDGTNYYALPISGRVEYPRKHPRTRGFTAVVRPTAGAELVSSHHFPADAQGNFLITNVIGFHGVKNHRVVPQGSGYTSTEAEPLLVSSDANFRPVDLQFGPDGALYVVDWYNPLIGHMQHSLFDPRRDRTHGRIWRVTYPANPLLPVQDLERLSVRELLELLTAYEDRTRYRVRRELRERDRDEVLRELARWVAALRPEHPEHEHHLLEALWAYQGRDHVEPVLLGRLLGSRDPRARAAATRVVRHWADRLADPLALLRERVADEHPQVRLEAVVALSFLRSAAAAEAALESRRHPGDYYLDYALEATVTALEPYWKPALLAGEPLARENPEGLLLLLDRLGPDEIARVARSAAVDRALLQRARVPLESRREALAALAAGSGTAPAALLLAALRDVDGRPGTGDAARDLAVLLAEREPRELLPHYAELERLAADGADTMTRQAALLAMMRANGGAERVWQAAHRSPAALLDLLAAAEQVGDPVVAVGLAHHVRRLLARRPAAATGGGVRGRFVRIEQPGCCETMSLAEVQVFEGRVNLAPSGRAEQKSTVPGGEAERAIDGNTAPRFRDGSVSQGALLEVDPWWELDLGETRPIGSVVIWRREDPQIGGDLNGFHLRVLDAARRPVWQVENQPARLQPLTFALGGDSLHMVRRAAIRSMGHLPLPPDERLALLRSLLRQGADPDLVVPALAAALAGRPAGRHAAEIATGLLAVADRTPAADRGGPTFAAALELGRSLAPTLPAAQRGGVAAGVERLAPRRVRIVARVAAMRFDIERFDVAAGQEIELVLENPDHMPHNVVFTAPGALELVGRAADAMATQPDAFARHFVPDLPQVIAATRLIGKDERTTLRFRAPTAPGEYPFICTFPGHWITMRGVMRVQARPTSSTR
jgi:glucose/arabinose dehydrogenase/azurin